MRATTAGLAVALTIGTALAASCATVPSALKYGSLALTGASYLATGKGTSDHLLSALVERDCALLRLVQDRPVCTDRGSPQQATVPRTNGQRAQHTVASDHPPRSTQTTDKPPAFADTAGVYLVIGSFQDRRNAERWRDRHAQWRAAVAPAAERNRETSHYRVVLGPYREAESLRRKVQLASLTQTDVWRVRLCSGTLVAPPCKPELIAQH